MARVTDVPQPPDCYPSEALSLWAHFAEGLVLPSLEVGRGWSDELRRGTAVAYASVRGERTQEGISYDLLYSAVAYASVRGERRDYVPL